MVCRTQILCYFSRRGPIFIFYPRAHYYFPKKPYIQPWSYIQHTNFFIGHIFFQETYLVIEQIRFFHVETNIDIFQEVFQQSRYTFFFYKKPGEGLSSKSFLFLAKNCMFLVPKVSYLVS